MSEMSTWGSRSGKERSFSCSTVTWMVMVSLGCVMDDFEIVRAELSLHGAEYPTMKLMDMCMWQVAFEQDHSRGKDCDEC